MENENNLNGDDQYSINNCYSRMKSNAIVAVLMCDMIYTIESNINIKKMQILLMKYTLSHESRRLSCAVMLTNNEVTLAFKKCSTAIMNAHTMIVYYSLLQDKLSKHRITLIQHSTKNSNTIEICSLLSFISIALFLLLFPFRSSTFAFYRSIN